MNSGNLPLGADRDERAPYNEDKQELKLDLQREQYTECCQSEDFRYNKLYEVHICSCCGLEASIYTESDEDFEKRYNEAEEAEINKLKDFYD